MQVDRPGFSRPVSFFRRSDVRARRKCERFDARARITIAELSAGLVPR
jgi:hypothetical protein